MIELVNRETGELLDIDSVPGLAEVAALHDGQIDRLNVLVQDLLDQDDGTVGNRQGPVIWHLLDPYESALTWRELAGWVGWLRGRYPLAHRVPLCWWRHPELVEELTALWLAWRDAYVENGAPLSAGADWHGRLLPEFLRRLGAGGWNLACEDDHRPPVLSLYDDRRVDDDAAFADHINTPRRTSDLIEGAPTMHASILESAVASGDATRLGDLPDSPVLYDGRYWARDNDGWSVIESEETIAYLRDAHQRLQMADAAVQERS